MRNLSILLLILMLALPRHAAAQQTPFTASSTCLNDTINFGIRNSADIDSVKWFFGDPASSAQDSSRKTDPWHVYHTVGTYNDTLIAWRKGVADTTIQPITIVAPIIWRLGPRDTTLCRGSSIILQAPVIPGAQYLWQDSSTKSFIVADTSLTYKVKVNGCLIPDSVNVFFTPIPKINLGPDLVLCSGQHIALDATAQNCTYLWNTGNTQPTQDVRSSGTYRVRVFPKGCAEIDAQATITFNGPPYPFSLGSDTLLCPGESITLAPNVPQATAWKWSTGATTPSVTVSSEGNVWALVEINHICNVVDTIFINYNRLHKIHLGNDTTICRGNFLVLNANFGNGTYRWQDGSDQATYYVTKPGNYWVHAQIGRCESTDTIHVSYDDTLHVNLGRDTILCNGEPYTLYPAGAGGNYKWQDSTTVPFYPVTKAGLYAIIAYNTCGKTTGSVMVNFRDCACNVYFPNAFTPNGDGRNDIFRPIFRCPMSHYTLSIYNRWGNRLFFTTDPQFGWTGTYQGRPVDIGTYVWILDYKDGNTNLPVHKTGMVTVLY